MKLLIRSSIIIFTFTITAVASDAVFTKAPIYQQDRLAFKKQVRLSNRLNRYRLDFTQSKPTAKQGPKFEIRMREPTVYFSFSRPLNDFMKINVNGMKHTDIEPKEKDFNLWKKENSAGVDFTMNFDGAKIILSYWLRNNSPVLWGRISQINSQQNPIKTIEVTFRFVPSKVVNTAYSGVYQNKIITPAKTYQMNQINKWNCWQTLTAADKYLICLDEKYEAGDNAPGKPAIGPCFITIDFSEIEKAQVDIPNYYTNFLKVQLKPEYQKFNFGLWESEKEYTNKGFRKYLEENISNFTLSQTK